MEFKDNSVIELIEMLQSKKVTSKQLSQYYINRIKNDKETNAVVEIFDDALVSAENADIELQNGITKTMLGIPVLIADNINFKDKKMTCGSKFLKDYVAVYTADVITKLLEAGCVIIGRANVGEFGIDNSTISSINGVTHNAINSKKVAGGGIASAIASGFAPVGIDADPRISASYNGVVGLKPTEGRISRFGAFTTLLDQVGIVTRNCADSEYVLNVLSGKSKNDEKSVEKERYCKLEENLSTDNFKIGISSEIIESIENAELKQNFVNFVDWLKNNNVEVVKVDCPDFKFSLPTYQILECAEVSSNLDRFDGVKYTQRDNEIKNVYDFYSKTRAKSFDDCAKMEVMLGNFVISSNNFKNYFDKSKLVQSKLIKQKNEMFKHCDFLILPTTINDAFDIADSSYDFVENLKENKFTAFANLVGIPSLSIPFAYNKEKMPFGLQIVAEQFNEKKMFEFAKFIERNWR